MPLSNLNSQHVNTIEIVSSGAVPDFSYTFQIEQNSTVQILWAFFNYTAAAGGGARIPIMTLADDQANIIFQLTYFASVAAGATLGVTMSQGAAIVPSTVLGRPTGIPADGLFAKNNYTLRFFPFPAVSAADAFSGYFQTRGLHNSQAQQ